MTDPIRAVGPIVIDPVAQGHGWGARGIRLVQDSFNVLSLSLYAALGFNARENLVVLSGAPSSAPGVARSVSTRAVICTRYWKGA